MALGPCFWLKTMYVILLFESDLRTCFFPVLLYHHVLFLKRCMADVVNKGQSSNGVGKSLFAVYLENTLFKDKFIRAF